MGNRSSTAKGGGNIEKEMVQPKVHIKPPESMLTLEELLEMCEKLEESIGNVSTIVDSVVFQDSASSAKGSSSSVNHRNNTNTDMEEAGVASTIEPSAENLEFNANNDVEQIETKFVAMARLIQNLIHELTEQLDNHSKRVTRSSLVSNVKLMECVVSLVNNVNSYMAMLIRNIRKLGRLMSERDSELSEVNRRLQNDEPVPDVVMVTQDIDAMLMELRGTEKQREDLENDVIDVMMICKDCREILRLQEEAL